MQWYIQLFHKKKFNFPWKTFLQNHFPFLPARNKKYSFIYLYFYNNLVWRHIWGVWGPRAGWQDQLGRMSECSLDYVVHEQYDVGTWVLCIQHHTRNLALSSQGSILISYIIPLTLWSLKNKINKDYDSALSIWPLRIHLLSAVYTTTQCFYSILPNQTHRKKYNY